MLTLQNILESILTQIKSSKKRNDHEVYQWGHRCIVYLWHRADGVHLSYEFTIGLKQQKELEVKFVQSLTQLQLLWMIQIHW